jgi:hypothetical protein
MTRPKSIGSRTRRPGRMARRAARSGCRPKLEVLEGRLTPAATITVLASGVGSLDATLLANNGTITVNDGAAGGTQDETLSRAALLAVPATSDINVAARTAVTFADQGGQALALATAAGHTASFLTTGPTAGAITFANAADELSTAGGALSLSAGTDLTPGHLSTGPGADVTLSASTQAAGTLTLVSVSAPGHTVTLNSGAPANIYYGTPLAPGTVAGTPDGVPDVTAASLAVTAGTAVGSLSAPLELEVGTFAALAGDGGIAVTPLGSGGLTAGTVGTVYGVSATGGTIAFLAGTGVPLNLRIAGHVGKSQLAQSGAAVAVQARGGAAGSSVLLGGGGGAAPDYDAIPYLDYSGGGGFNSLTVDDHGAQSEINYDISGSWVSNGQALVYYHDLQSVKVVTTEQDTTINVWGTAVGAPLTVNVGGGPDRVNVNGSYGLYAPVTVNGGSGSDTIAVSATHGGPVTVNAGTGSNQLVVYSGGDVILSPTFVANADTGYTVSYPAAGGAFRKGVVLVTGGGNDVVGVWGTAAGGATCVYTMGGDDRVEVLASDGNANTLASPLSLDLGPGKNALLVSEATRTTGDAVMLTCVNDNSYDGAFTAPGFRVLYTATSGTFGGGLSLATGSGDDTIGAQATHPGDLTCVFTGAGNDYIELAPSVQRAGASITLLNGPLAIDAGTGSNMLLVNQKWRTVPDSVALTAGSVYSTLATFTANYALVKPFTVYYTATGGTFAGGLGLVTGTGDDRVTVSGVPAGAPVEITNAGGADQVDVAVTAGSGYSLVVNGGPGGDTLTVTDYSGGAVVHSYPTGAGAGAVQVLYDPGLESLIWYLAVEQLLTQPPPS